MRRNDDDDDMPDVLHTFRVPDDDEIMQPMQDNRVDEASDFTDESSASSDEEVIEHPHRAVEDSAERQMAITSVKKRLQLMRERSGAPALATQLALDVATKQTSWYMQVPVLAVSLTFSSLFVFPPRMPARVAIYNFTTHVTFEMYLIALIMSYSIFQACWNHAPDEPAPAFALWSDVFCTVAYCAEAIAKIFCHGLYFHKKAYFRSAWNVLDFAAAVLAVLNLALPHFGNYTAIRLIRLLRSATYVKWPIGLKLLAKAVLRSFYGMAEIAFVNVYALFFFSLLGMQLFNGELRQRCIYDGKTGLAVPAVQTGNTTTVPALGSLFRDTFLCNHAAGSGGYMGQACPPGYHCANVRNPHFNLQSFDDIGHSFLAVFQIVTLQNWPLVLNETNDVENCIAFLYYFVLIVVCTFFIPSLVVGVVMENLDKTRDEFVANQVHEALDLQQQLREKAASEFRIQRIERHAIPREAEQNAPQRPLTAPGQRPGTAARNSAELGETPQTVGKPQRTWTESQRVQLQLALSRQFDVAEEGEADRQLRSAHHNRPSSSATQRPKTVDPSTTRPGTAAAPLDESTPMGRIESVQKQTSFLQRYQNRTPNGLELHNMHSGTITPNNPTISVASRSSQPVQKDAILSKRVATEEGFDEPLDATRAEKAHVPVDDDRHPRQSSVDDMAAQQQSKEANAALPVVVQDPEGGDLSTAVTFAEKFEIIRNTVHMFTEGYPRIISLYLHEHDKLRRRFNMLRDAANKHEAAAKRAMGVEVNDDDDFADEDDGKLTPLDAARSIVHNAPMTWFMYLMFACVVVNLAILAARHYEQPDAWVHALFVLNLVFTLFFFVEILMRMAALGVKLYLSDAMNIMDVTIVLLSFIELGFNQSNSISAFNGYRLLRTFKVQKVVPSLRKLSRVLVFVMEDLAYVLIFLFTYVVGSLLIGMSLFGGRFTPIYALDNDDLSRATFDNFSFSLYSVMQAFSRVRDDWLAMTWTGMRATGNFTIIYFVGVMIISAIFFQPMFLAILADAFEREEEMDEQATGSGDAAGGGSFFGQLGAERWFNFSLFNAFKQTTRGYQRRLVAPDEVYHLNSDMKKLLLVAERKDRQYMLTAANNPPGVNMIVLQQPQMTSPMRPERQQRDLPPLAEAPPHRVHAINDYVLLQGPTLERKKVQCRGGYANTGMWEFERCEKCGDFKYAVLPSPSGSTQRTADALHEEHCDAAAERVSRQLVLNTLVGYVRQQVELHVEPTRHSIETVLGQAWTCGMLLSENAEKLARIDDTTGKRSWVPLEKALEVQQWILDLRVGEEQLGRATNALMLSHATRGATLVDEPATRSLYVFSATNPVRTTIQDIAESAQFELLIFIAIVGASICLAFYNPLEDQSTAKYDALHGLDALWTAIFILEMLFKWISYGVVTPRGTAYFWSKWNIFDFFIVIISIISLADPSVSCRSLKALRLFRIVRPVRLLSFNQGLEQVAATIFDSMKGLASLGIVTLLSLTIWSILGLQIYTGRMMHCTDASVVVRENCTGMFYSEVATTFPNETTVDYANVSFTRKWIPARRNFNNFAEAILTMFEVSTGSSWLEVIYQGVDSVGYDEAMLHNANAYGGLFFVAFYLVGGFIMMTMIAAVVIFNYFKAMRKASGCLGMTMEQEYWIRTQRFLLKLRPKVQLTPLNNSVSKFLSKLNDLWILSILASIAIFGNIITMAVYYYDMSDYQKYVLNCLQYLWVAIFTLETGFHFGTYGPRAFKHKSFAFDFLCLVLSYLQIILNDGTSNHVPFNLNILRMLRVVRVMQLVRFLPLNAKHVRIYIQTLFVSAPAIINVTLLLCICYYVFAIIGVSAFAHVRHGELVDNKYTNFSSFLNALLLLFRLSTLEGWDVIMRDLMATDFPYCSVDPLNPSIATWAGSCGTKWAPVFFIPFVLMTAFVIIVIYVAVIVEGYTTTLHMETSAKRLGDVYKFIGMWSEFDPDATMLMKTDYLKNVLTRLSPPYGLRGLYDRKETLNLLADYRIPDHNGYVHFFEVLIPIARRAMAVKINRSGGGAEASWQESESSLKALPVVRHRHSVATAEQHYAASYVAAAYRRRKAILLLAEMKRERMADGHRLCTQKNLDPQLYGYHSIPFGNAALLADPLAFVPDCFRSSVARNMRLVLSHRAASALSLHNPLAPPALQEGATASTRQRGTEEEDEQELHQLPSSVARQRRSKLAQTIRSEGDLRPEEAAAIHEDAQYHLPAQYSSAIEEKRHFGPEVPNAIVRHEKRRQKLLKLAQQANAAGEMYAPLGTNPEVWRAGAAEGANQLH